MLALRVRALHSTIERHRRPMLWLRLPRSMGRRSRRKRGAPRARHGWHLTSERMRLARAQASRFWTKVSKTKTCWLWMAGKDKDGYGKFQLSRGGKSNQLHVRAHRIAYELTHGEVKAPLVVMHSCDVAACVNPAHLSVGTQADNRRDCGTKGRNATGDRSGMRKHPEKVQRGSRHYRATMLESDVLILRLALRDGETISSLAKRFNLPYQRVWSAVRGKSWKHLPGAIRP